jgi:nicotinamide phosphoribosyltransferase
MFEHDMLSRQELFARGPIRVPWPVRGDAYTVSSDKIVSAAAKEKSVYNFTNRRLPSQAFPGIAKDGRMVLYGLTDFIQRELTAQDNEADVELSDAFMSTANSFGGGLDFDKDMWLRVVREYNGYLPIKIEALPQGSTFWANEPVVQVTSLGKGFGEIAAIVEAALVGYVSCATARLTLTRHLLERIRDLVREYNPTYTKTQVDTVAQWMIHDFGMRASSTTAESEIYGRAHLLVFNGSDTTNAAFQAWMMGASRPIGTSILALAHRIVMGYATEEEAYEAIYAATGEEDNPVKAGSYVADCYDFHNAVRTFLVAMAKRRGNVVVARPDSGDYLENVLFIVEEALKANLYQVDEEGRPSATTLRFIQGDSMNYEKMCNVFKALDERLGVNPTAWGIFGVGGWLRNVPNRDVLSSAFKLSAYGLDNTPSVKLSDTLAKMSVPGPNVIVRPDYVTTSTVHFAGRGYDSHNKLVTFYNGAHKNIDAFYAPCYETFDTERDRVIKEFDSYASCAADYGSVDNSPLSREIREFQKAVMEQHGRKVEDFQF